MSSFVDSSMLALALGYFCKVLPTILRRKEVNVRCEPFFSYAGECFLRRAKRFVISASSNWLILGIVAQDSIIRRLTVRLRGDIRSRRTGPHLAKSMDSVCDTVGWEPVS